jgi:hypothetical protein
MTTITTRAGKGSPLTNTEVDDNFSNLNSAKYESGSTGPLFANTLNVTSSGGQNYVQGDIRLSSSTINSPGVRGQGVFMFNEGADKTWYAGTGYNAGGDYHIGFVAGAALNTAAAVTTNAHMILYSSPSIVFNEGSQDMDFRVESNDNANMIVVDAATNSVGIGGIPSSSQTLDVHGKSLHRTGGSDPAATVANYNSGMQFLGGNMRLNIDVSSVSNGGSYIQTRHANDAYPTAVYNLNLNPLGGYVVLNEEGNSNAGFRVESDNNSHILFVDGGNDRVLFGSASNVENGFVQVHGTKSLVSGIPQGSLSVNDDTAMGVGVGGAINFTGKYHTNGTATSLASVEGYKTLSNNGNYDGTLVLKARAHGGDQVDKLSLNSTEAVFNEDGLDTNFRVESDTYTHKFFINADFNGIGIGTATVSNHQRGSGIDFEYDGTIYAGSTWWAGGMHLGTNFVIQADGTTQYKHANRQATRIVNNSQGGSIEFYSVGGDSDATTTQVWHDMAYFSRDDVVFNNGGAIQNFRVESNYTASALAVDGDTGAVEIGTGIIGRGVTDNFTLNGKTQPHYGFNLDPGSGVHMGISGYYGISIATAGSERLTIFNAGTAVFNDIGADADFRVESDTNANALFVDASENTVVFGNTAVNLASGYTDQTGMGVHANDGYVQIASNSTPLTLGRTTAAGRGAHILLRHASGVVGEFGDYNGVPYIGYTGGAGGGLMFNGASIEPTAIGNARTDGANDIGSSNYRWRDGKFSRTVQAKTFERLWNFADLTALDSGYFYPVSLDGGSASVQQSFELFKYYGSYNGSTGVLGAVSMKMDIAGYSWGGNVIHNYVHHAASTYRCMLGAVTLRGYYVPVIWLRGGFGYHWTSNNPNIVATIHSTNATFYTSPYNYTIGRITDSVMQGKTGYLAATHHEYLGHEDTNCNNWYT